MKWKMGLPVAALVNRGVPSGITPLPCVARMAEHRFVVLAPVARQWMHLRADAEGEGAMWGARNIIE